LRRRTIIPFLLAVAALATTSIALADAPGTTLAYPALNESPDAQNGPAVAVNPVGGTSTEAVVVASDWRNGPLWPETAFANAPISGTSGATNWHDNGILPPTTGNSPDTVSGGSPAVAWGPGNMVFAVQLGRSSSSPRDPCASGTGLYLSVSTDGGSSFGQPVLLVQGGQNAQILDPAIAYSAATGKIYVAYTKLDACGSPATGGSVRMVSTSDFVTGNNRPVVAVATAGSAFGRASIAALSNGSVAVAYYDQSALAVDVSVCDTSSGSPVCPASPTAVLDSSAQDVGQLASTGVPVLVRPSIAASPLLGHGRVVVTWARAQLGGGSTISSATSVDSGQDFGPAQQVTPAGTIAYRFDPSVAVSPDDRADIAYLDSGVLSPALGVVASASNLPLALTVWWSTPQSIESTAINQLAPTSGSQPSLGGRLGIAELPRPGSRAWTLIAWTDTRNASTQYNEDIYSTVLKHQGTTPVASIVPTVVVPKGATQPVSFGAYVADADADPLTYSIATNGNLGTATIPDPNVPVLSYAANPVKGIDAVQVVASDGVNQTTLTIPLSLVNYPPVIACPMLTTTYDKAIVFSTTSCGFDANGDPVTFTADTPKNGTITGAGSALAFAPTPGFTGQASVVLTASDGELSSAPTTVPITVLPAPAVGVDITTKDALSTRTDRPIQLTARPATDQASGDAIVWHFGDGTTDMGSSVSHLFTRADTYKVTAQIGQGDPAGVSVTVQAPPVLIRDTSLLHKNTIKLRLQLANAGTLKVSLAGVSGSHKLQAKMKRGAHTVRMLVPAAALHRGTIVVLLTLTEPNKVVVKMRRAVLLPR
jgi:hypothetical protein